MSAGQDGMEGTRRGGGINQAPWLDGTPLSSCLCLPPSPSESVSDVHQHTEDPRKIMFSMKETVESTVTGKYIVKREKNPENIEEIGKF